MTRDPLTPNAEEVAALRDQVGDGPVIIMNLLKYKASGGREAFTRLAGDPEYLEKAPALREAALERTLWMVTQPPAE